MVSKSENYQEDELVETPREKKLKKKKYPRPRVLVQKEVKKLAIIVSKRKEVEEASQKISKHLRKFPDLDTKEGRKQAEKYLNWVVDSLMKEEIVIRDADLDFKTSISSVKAGGQQRQKTRSSVRATHLPTLISVRNEEERTQEQNKRAAYENLVSRLTTHLSLWQTLAQKNPDTYSIGEISRQGLSLLKSLIPK